MAGSTLVHKLLQRPRSLLIWKFSFQVHLWAGLLLTLYLIVIGTTGSILVFRVELERLSGQRPWPASTLPHSLASMDRVFANLEAAFPSLRTLDITAPTLNEPYFSATIQGHGQRKKIRLDPQTAAIVGEIRTTRSWLDFVADLHTTVLAGRYGRLINGAGSVLLLLMNLTGLAIWWPGIRWWKRSLVVDLRRSWKRINFDLHRALGFWALAIISVWAVSGVYFAWPQEVFNFIGRLSPFISAQPPVVIVRPEMNSVKPGLAELIASARSIEPEATLTALNFPYSRRAPLEILMQRKGNRTGREYTDVLYFDPFSGKHLGAWHYGVNQSVGDWLIWLQVPLHFGTYWGLGFKLFWAAAGLSIPLLATTGAVMYWNRVLRRLW